MKQKEVESALEQRVRFQVPSDRAVPLSVNRGNPVVLAESGADFSKAVREMAKIVATPQQEDAGKKRRFLAKA
jgi:MinD-like ATPase involved in chromosome partitioning or flagellar assembly